MGAAVAVITVLVAAAMGLAWMVGQSWLRQRLRKSMIEDVEAKHSSRLRTDTPAPVQHRAGASSRPGSAFGRVHLGVAARHDPSFSELEVLELFAEVITEALSRRRHPALSEGALATLTGGPRGELTAQVQLGQLQVHGVFADELWTNVEVAFEALMDEEDGAQSWRQDRWRFRRRHGDTWQVATISDSRRLLQLPEPPLLPLGPAEGALLPAVDLNWPPFLAAHPELFVQAEARLRELLDGEHEAWSGLERALHLDRQRAQGRRILVDRIEVVQPLRASTDASHHLAELRLVVQAKAWRGEEPPQAFGTHHAALTVAKELAGGDWIATNLRWISPPPT